MASLDHHLPHPSANAAAPMIAASLAEAATATAQPPLMPSPPAKYPPMSSVPKTTPARLGQPETPASPTVFYLAYGSNLAASTFLGTRGIRPVSRISVSAPTLDLIFDLPGVPYNEPCFANSALRKIPEKLPPPPTDPFEPPRPTLPGPGAHGKWDKGLIGVVYEVTRKDFATILETEGGGASYQDIMVPCFALPIELPSPSHPQVPKPFLAHSLFAPSPPERDPKAPWYKHILHPARRTTAQPSERYLGLIQTGAKENDLPQDWQDYLASLTPYTATSRRQKIGGKLFSGLFLPFLLVFMVLAPAIIKLLRKVVDGGDAKLPAFIIVGMTVMQNLLWALYDGWAKNVFGNGENTEEKAPDEERAPLSFWGCSRRKEAQPPTEVALPGEKEGLLVGQ